MSRKPTTSQKSVNQPSLYTIFQEQGNNGKHFHFTRMFPDLSESEYYHACEEVYKYE